MTMDFAERIVEARRHKHSIAVLGIDPKLDTPKAPGIPEGYSLSRFCCEIVEACAPSVVAIKPQLAFFEARGVAGMSVLVEILKLARSVGLVTIADAKRGDVGLTSAAYAEAFLGDGDFGCDAVTVNPYLGSDALAPFVARARGGRGVFVLVKTSNPSSGEFQDRHAPDRPLWEAVAERIHGWGSDFIDVNGFTPVGAVVGATYPDDARRARELMPNSLILVPGYGAQGADAKDSVAAARSDEPAILVSASRSLMYAWQKTTDRSPADAASEAAEAMRHELNDALRAQKST